MIEVKNLIKDYGTRRALHGISFTVEKGHVYGLLGPNGAGKSTTMNIITGCLAATSGTVTVDGHDIYKDPIAAKRLIGYLPEQPPLYTDMKVTEYLNFVGRAKGLRGNDLYGQLDEVLRLTGLERVHGRMIRNLSKGYKQRVGIAQAILGNPEVIILDEPTVGLDPIQIIEIRDLIRSLADGHTVILSSHILQEISAVCDRIMMISDGRLVADDTVGGLEAAYSSEATLTVTAHTSKTKLASALEPIGSKEGIRIDVRESDRRDYAEAVITHPAGTDIAEDVFRVLCGAGVPVCAMVPHVMTLEEIFLMLTETQEEAMAEPAPTVYETLGGMSGTDGDGNENNESNGGNDSDGANNGGGDGYTPLFS